MFYRKWENSPLFPLSVKHLILMDALIFTMEGLLVDKTDLQAFYLMLNIHIYRHLVHGHFKSQPTS